MRLLRPQTKWRGPRTGPTVAGLLEGTARRLEEIVAAARRAAEDIRSDAERMRRSASIGRSESRERLVSDLVEALSKRADELRGEAEELARILERAWVRLAALEGGRNPALPARPPAWGPSLRERLSVRSPTARGKENGPPPRGASEGMRLLATQMALAGSSREEIEERLRRDFGVQDASTILAEVLER